MYIFSKMVGNNGAHGQIGDLLFKNAFLLIIVLHSTNWAVRLELTPEESHWSTTATKWQVVPPEEV